MLVCICHMILIVLPLSYIKRPIYMCLVYQNCSTEQRVLSKATQGVTANTRSTEHYRVMQVQQIACKPYIALCVCVPLESRPSLPCSTFVVCCALSLPPWLSQIKAF